MSNSKNIALIKDIIIGVSDGLTVPFALTAGMGGVTDSNHLIIIAGLAEIAAGSIAMGLGGFLAGESDIHNYEYHTSNEYYEIETIPESEIKEVENVFLELGIDHELTIQVTEHIIKDKDKWVNFMLRFEIGLEKPDKARAAKSGFNIAMSYLCGGFIPLLPYFFTSNNKDGLLWSSIITVFALFVFGYFKSKVTNQPLLKGTLKVVGIGILAAGAAYGLAKLVS